MVGRMPAFFYSTFPLLKKQVTNWSLSVLCPQAEILAAVCSDFGGCNYTSGKGKQRQKIKREEHQVRSECFLVPLLVEATESLSWFQCKTNKEGMSFSLWFARLQSGAVLA